MNNPDKFSEEFKNTTITISVAEMGEIIARKLAEITDSVLDSKDADLEDLLVHASVLVILNKFGAEIMYEMFENLNHIEIDDSDK